MFRLSNIIIGVGIALLLGIHHAMAGAEPKSETQNRVCANSRLEMTWFLQDKFGEISMGHGVNYGGAMMELYVNPAKGNWTVVYSNPDRKRWCVLTAGYEGKHGAWTWTNPQHMKPIGQDI